MVPNMTKDDNNTPSQEKKKSRLSLLKKTKTKANKDKDTKETKKASKKTSKKSSKKKTFSLSKAQRLDQVMPRIEEVSRKHMLVPEPEDGEHTIHLSAERILQGRPLLDEREKALARWIKHLNDDAVAYEKCLGCEEYHFMDAQIAQDSIAFTCRGCGLRLSLTR